MTARAPFQYAILRVVPHVERGEAVNAGVVVFCRPRRFLAARTELDERLLRALAPQIELGTIARLLAAAERIAAGAEDGGPIARLPASDRFHWLVAPSSTVLQASPVHTGLTEDPQGTLDHLFGRLVLR